MQQITIDPEFQALIPPLSAEERAQLEANLLADGCRDPLVVWRARETDQERDIAATYVLIDGHNRYEICTRNGVDFDTQEIDFDSRDDAILWIVRNQFGRRNLSDYVRAQLALRVKPLVEARAKTQQQGGQGGVLLSQKSDEANAPIRTDDELAKMAGVSRDTIRKVERIESSGSEELKQALGAGELSINLASDLATLEAEKQKEVVAGGKDVAREAVKAIREDKAKAKKEKRRAELDSQVEAIASGEIAQPSGLFDVIAIDPPWAYGREYDPDGSRIANPYPEMSQEQIKAIDLPVKNDCVLFLWTTHQFIFDAKELLDHWGFEYKATMVWDKEKIGMGAWLRMQCEFCLVAIKGKPFWDNTTHRDIIREAKREHSRKPEAFYSIVEEITAGRRLEYFSRQARSGWEVFGNDTSKF